jgi:hypothetical protein
MKRGQYPTIEARIVDKVNDECLEYQLAIWMVDVGIDPNSVMNYIREVEETRYKPTE